VHQRDREHERVLVQGEEVDSQAYSKRMREDKIKVAELGVLLRKEQERGIAIAKEMVALVLGAERRIPVKLVARRCHRVVTVEVLDEGMQGYLGKTTRTGFFAARREEAAGRVRIVPEERLMLSPEDFEYERKSPPLPADLEVVKSLSLGRLFPESDMRKELDFGAIVAMFEEGEPTAAKIAGRKS
jgi:hypothetical protein